MSVFLFPAVVWALDDGAEEHVERWYRGVDSDTRRFVEWARALEGVESSVARFTRASFAEELRPLGVRLPETTRITVVMVSSAVGVGAFQDWTTAEAALDVVDRKVVACERIRVLLAGPAAMARAGGALQMNGIRSVPWLVSGRLDTGHVLSDDEFDGCVDLLLRGILLADRSPRADHRSVFDAEVMTGAVRLLGFPAVNPSAVLGDLAALFTSAVLFDCCEERSDRPNGSANTYAKARKALSEFKVGKITAQAALQASLGSAGLGSWDSDQLMTDGSGFLRELMSRLDEPVSIAAAPQQPESLWARLVAAVRLLLGGASVPAAAPPHAEVPESETDYLRARLKAAKQLLDGLRDSAGVHRPGCHLPPEQIAMWKSELRTLIAERLRRIAEGVAVGQATHSSVLEQVRERARAYAATKFASSASSWNVTARPLGDAVRQFVSGVPLRFTGRILAGTPQPYAVAASLDVPFYVANMVRTEYWRGAGTVLFGASASVEAQTLTW